MRVGLKADTKLQLRAMIGFRDILSGWKDRQTHRRTDKQTNKQTDGRTDGQTGTINIHGR